MKPTIFLFIFLVSSMFVYSQTYKKTRLTKKDGQVQKLKNVTLDPSSNTLHYLDIQGTKETASLNLFTKLEYKKGSYWLPSLGGGLVGSILVNLIIPEREEWWHGAGPSILIAAGVGTIIGLLIPKYKEINITKNTKLEITPVALRITF